MRVLGVAILVMVWNVSVCDVIETHILLNNFRLSILMFLRFQQVELNTFFLKHIFDFLPSHPLCFARLIFIAVISAPTIR